MTVFSSLEHIQAYYLEIDHEPKPSAAGVALRLNVTNYKLLSRQVVRTFLGTVTFADVP